MYFLVTNSQYFSFKSLETIKTRRSLKTSCTVPCKTAEAVVRLKDLTRCSKWPMLVLEVVFHLCPTQSLVTGIVKNEFGKYGPKAESMTERENKI